MTRMLVAVIVFAFALPGLAGAGEKGKKNLTPAQRIQLERLRWEVGLDADQIDAVREAMLEERKRTRKAILEILDADQKKAFEEMERRVSPKGFEGIRIPGLEGGLPEGLPEGFPKGGIRFSGFGKGGPLGITVKLLKKEIGLSEEEAEKIGGIFETYRKEARERMEKMARDFDFEKIMDAARGKDERAEKALKEAREALAEEKREAFDALVEKRKKNRPAFRTVTLGGDGPGLEGLGDALKEKLKGLGERIGKMKQAFGEEEAALSPEAICDALGLSGEERVILRERIVQVQERRKDLASFLREGRASLKGIVSGDASADDAKARLDDFRNERRSQEDALQKAREELRSLLTYAQEAKLVAMGVLD